MSTPNRWILTHSRVHFSLTSPRAEDVRIDDIAWALAGLNRFTGHGSHHYSVAEHSVHVWRRVRDLGGTMDEQRAALLHDAPEAYVGDASSPLKAAMRVILGRYSRGISDYDRVEELVWHACCAALGLSRELPPLVRQADHELVTIEGAVLFGPEPLPPEWGPCLPLTAAEHERYRPLCWPAALARARFLSICNGLAIC